MKKADFLENPIALLPRTSGVTIRRLKLLGIASFWDLLNYFPFRYEDYSRIIPINRLHPAPFATIRGKVLHGTQHYTKRGFSQQKIAIEEAGAIAYLIWYNQPYLLRMLKVGSMISVVGRIDYFRSSAHSGLALFPEEYEFYDKKETLHTGRIIPIYPEKRGLSSRTIREKIAHILMEERKNPGVVEPFPMDFIRAKELLDERAAYREVHFPSNLAAAEAARKRLSFDELTIIKLSSYMVKKAWRNEKVSNKFSQSNIVKNKVNTFTHNLPFVLTKAQKRCIEEIMTDFSKPTPMNRLLQGEVGSGKTVVAAIAAYAAYLHESRTLFLAPTEILAMQHYKTLSQLFIDSSQSHIDYPSVVLCTASIKPKKDMLEKANIILGTHAILNKTIHPETVGLVIIDEQQKFGVSQRALIKKKGAYPHLLTMTATPIPRTVLLTIFAELDLSVIDEMPRGRGAVKTFLVPPEKRSAAYAWIKKEIQKKRSQVFVVCPFIDLSEKETLTSVKAAKKEFIYLKNTVFPASSVELLHGRMKSNEKETVMKRFTSGHIDVLVSTPVVEVGIDIPNATIIIIEGAERFGLSQLHQLRGRVGRGGKQSYCLLFTGVSDEKVEGRLRTFSSVYNGFELAEYDLKIRGGGELFGTRQHGVPMLKIASFSDKALLNLAHECVSFIATHDISNYPELQKRLKQYTISLISRD
ncbi:MAG TPA: ATP-dependent DNA helicase RecG [Patescibacteria group bacterium]|nr:ATP-dependent DNA helicase RecG [Patescibacteria group bacterium]